MFPCRGEEIQGGFTARQPGAWEHTRWKFSVFQNRGLTAALGDVGRLTALAQRDAGSAAGRQ